MVLFVVYNFVIFFLTLFFFTYFFLLSTGVVHGFAAVLGGRFENTPHGALCAVLLPYVFEMNAKCLQERAGLSDNHSNSASNFLQDPDRLHALV